MEKIQQEMEELPDETRNLSENAKKQSPPTRVETIDIRTHIYRVNELERKGGITLWKVGKYIKRFRYRLPQTLEDRSRSKNSRQYRSNREGRVK